MSVLSLPVDEFLNHAASRVAEPGGGAVAAVTGAGAAALVSMVGDLTIGKKGYRSVKAEVERLRDEAIVAMHALQDAAVEDGVAFHAYLRISSLPRDDATACELAAAAVRMTRAPLETAERCAQVLTLARALAPIGSAHAISDAGVALQLAYAALRSALLTIDVNLPFLQDVELADRIKTRSNFLERTACDDLNVGMRAISERLPR